VHSHQRSLIHTIILGVIIAAVIVIYMPGLTGPFVFDDWINIVNNDGIAIPQIGAAELRVAALSDVSGSLGRPLASITFALNYYFAGGFSNTFGFKLTNLLIHILNTALVYWFLHLLLKTPTCLKLGTANDTGRQRLIAGVATALWALHPIQLTSVLYVVQRMNSLAAFFMLAGLISYLYGRQQLSENPIRGLAFIWGGLTAGMVLGLTSKEIALLLPFYALVIEWTLFNHEMKRDSRRLFAAYLVPFVIMMVPVLWWLYHHGASLHIVYKLREFSMLERMLTETRVLWFYLGLLALPTTGRLTLFHDDVVISTGLLTPWTTLPAIIGLIASIFVAIWIRNKQPVASFGLLWFLIGHSMESGFIGLELVHEHRNYFPSIGFLFALSIAVITVASKMHMKRMITIAIVFLSVMFAFTTYVRARYWADEHILAEYLVRHHPRSARSHTMLAEALLKNATYNPLAAINHYHIAALLAPSNPSYLIRLVNIADLTKAQTNFNNIPLDIPLAVDRSSDQRPILRLQKNGNDAHLSIDKSVFSEIERRLSTEPLSGQTQSALAKLTECAVEHPDQCDQIQPRLVEWIKRALTNPRTNDSLRKALWMQLARLQIEQGDINDALESAQRSRKIDPFNASLAIMEANVRLLAGQKDAASDILSWLAVRPLNPSQREQVAALNQMLKAAP